jgi:hypothetical protein
LSKLSDSSAPKKREHEEIAHPHDGVAAPLVKIELIDVSKVFGVQLPTAHSLDVEGRSLAVVIRGSVDTTFRGVYISFFGRRRNTAALNTSGETAKCSLVTFTGLSIHF